MMLARVCRSTISPRVVSFLRAPTSNLTKVYPSRLFATEKRVAFTRVARNKNVLEKVVEPAAYNTYYPGKGLGAAIGVLGIGALCYYGLGLSTSEGIIDHSVLWPQFVKDRIHATYMYFGGSIAVSTATAALCMTSPSVMRLVSRGGWLALGASLVAMIGSGMLVQSIPYEEGFGPKQMAWLLHSGIIGVVLAPVSLVGGPILVRAAWYTAAMVGSLSALAVCAPAKAYLQLAGPLSMGMGVLIASTIGNMFLPPSTKLGSALYSMSLFGGLVLFSLLLMYNTQDLVHKAETHPIVNQQFPGQHRIKPYDPVNNAISIYLDTVNIFIRFVTLLAGGSRRK